MLYTSSPERWGGQLSTMAHVYPWKMYIVTNHTLKYLESMGDWRMWILYLRLLYVYEQFGLVKTHKMF